MNFSKTISFSPNSCCWTIKRTISKRPQTPTGSMSYALNNGKLSTENTNTTLNYMKNLYKNRNQSAATTSCTSLSQSTRNNSNLSIIGKNYYDLLGVKRNASLNDIKNAYYHLAKTYHPDVTDLKNPEKSTKFQQISEAYSCLIDESKRYEYDKFGRIKLKQLLPIQSNDDISIRNKSLCSKEISNVPANFTINNEELCIPITFLQAAHGTVRDINISNKIKCTKCTQNSLKLCNYCNGTGTYKNNEESDEYVDCKFCNKNANNRNRFVTVCTNCDGRGSIIKRHCITITIPAGANNEQMIKVHHPVEKNQIINVRLKIEPSQVFTKLDYDICSSIEIPFTTAILGGDICVKTIHGDVSIKIVPGTDSNTIFRILGNGIRKEKFGSGDHLVKIIVKMPKHLTNRQKLLMQSFNDNESHMEIINNENIRSNITKGKSILSSSPIASYLAKRSKNPKSSILTKKL